MKQLKIAPDVVNEIFDKYIEMKATHFIREIDWARLGLICSQAGYGWPSDVPALERSQAATPMGHVLLWHLDGRCPISR